MPAVRVLSDPVCFERPDNEEVKWENPSDNSGDTESFSSGQEPMPNPKSPNKSSAEISVTVTFTPTELAQLEAFAALHGEAVAAFIGRAALEATNITSASKIARRSANDTGALWLSESLADATKVEVSTDLFAPVAADTVAADAREEPETAALVPEVKRGVLGEQSRLAKGHGIVWEIRQALGRERVHGLGWTREQLAFVLKLSIVGVRKMEHLGTSPLKSLESRKALLNLAKTLENPGAEIVAYIEREEAALE